MKRARRIRARRQNIKTAPKSINLRFLFNSVGAPRIDFFGWPRIFFKEPTIIFFRTKNILKTTGNFRGGFMRFRTPPSDNRLERATDGPFFTNRRLRRKKKGAGRQKNARTISSILFYVYFLDAKKEMGEGGRIHLGTETTEKRLAVINIGRIIFLIP